MASRSPAATSVLIQGEWVRPDELDVHTLRELAMAPICVPRSLNSSARQSVGSSASSMSGKHRVGSGGERGGLKELCGRNFDDGMHLQGVGKEATLEDLILIQL